MLGDGSLINNRYKLLKKIGQGGFARVFLGTDELLKRQVAIKVLNSELNEDENFLERFQKEAQSVAVLHNTNILPVFDYGHYEDTAYLVMPYVSGGTLQDKLKGGKFLELEATAHYLQQAASALDYAHRRSIVHRDVKPHNMLIDSESDHLMLADFGIAKVLSSDSSQSRTASMGTLAYMSPEQLNGNVTRATDIYALGCVLFQMLTGNVPFNGPTEQVITAHLMRPIPDIVERSQGRVPPSVQPVLERAMAKRPEQRFATALDLAKAYRDAISDPRVHGGAASPTMPYSPPPGYSGYPNTNQASHPFRSGTSSPGTLPAGGFQGMPPGGSGGTPGSSGYSNPGTPPPGSGMYPPGTMQPGSGINYQYQNIPPAPAGLVTPPHGTQGYTGSPQTVAKKKPNLPVLISLAAVVLLVAVAVVIFLVLGNKPELQGGLREARTTFFSNGKLEQGIEQYKRLANSYPDDVQAQREYGFALHMWKREGDSLEPLQKASRLDGRNALTFLYLTDAYLDNNRFEEAEQAAKTAAELDKSGWYGHAALASVYIRTFKLDQAKTEFEAMQKAAGSDVSDPYYNWLVATYHQWDAKNKWPNAGPTNKLGYEALDKTIKGWPNLPQVTALRGFLFAATDVTFNVPRGLELIEQANSAMPQSLRILGYLSFVNRFFKDDFVASEKYVRDALKINDNDPDANLIMGGILGVRKDFKNAYLRYDKCIASNKYADQCFADYSYFLGLEAQEELLNNRTDNGNRLADRGLEMAIKAATFVPANVEYNYRVAYLHYLKKNYRDAIKILEKVLSGRNNSVRDFAILGLCYYYEGIKQGAQEMYDRGLKLDPNDFYIKLLGDNLKK
jgi:serine/threonine protein kinase/tetratricopeptide (TPR) repeat protein